MSLADFTSRLANTKKEVASLRKQMDSLRAEKERAVSMGDAEAAVKASRELKSLQPTLEELLIVGSALEIKVRLITAEERDQGKTKAAANYYEKHKDRIEYAREHAPRCSKCKKQMLLREEVGVFGEIQTGYGTWSFECRKCGILVNDSFRETEVRPGVRS